MLFECSFVQEGHKSSFNSLSRLPASVVMASHTSTSTAGTEDMLFACTNCYKRCKFEELSSSQQLCKVIICCVTSTTISNGFFVTVG